MPTVQVYSLNAFGADSKGGNPAGVVADAEGMTDAQMQQVARRVGYSETAFVLSAENAAFKVRYFTPRREVDLCGHATVATFHLLARLGRCSVGPTSQETNAGVLPIEVLPDWSVLMDQALPQFGETVPADDIAAAFPYARGIAGADLPVQVVSTGLRDIMVPVSTMEQLLSLRPDFEAMTRLSERYDVTGCHAFTLETRKGSTAHCRNFAPRFGIPEESATGTSNGALACYLYRHGAVGPEALDRLSFEQGYAMDQPSEIRARLHTGNDGAVLRVQVGGAAVPSGRFVVDVDPEL
ncbi:MAG: PhzF family phenazine biosynthesis protein [Synergistales bacterium]|nr:PhzF family phenazine biosynthesis protein [Synergistales bacterium]